MTIPRELKAIAATTIVVAISGLTSLAASARASEREIRVFSLQYSQSDVLGHLLSELMEGKDVKILVHQRTNSVVCLGDPSTLQVVESVLMKLDRHVDPLPGRSNANPLAEAPPPRSDTLTLSAPTAGKLEALIEDGVRVGEGERVAVIVATPASAANSQVEYELAKRNLEQQRAQAERAIKKIKQRLSSAQEERDLHQLELRVAKAEGELERSILEAGLKHHETVAQAVAANRRRIEGSFAAGTTSDETLQESLIAASDATRETETLRKRIAFNKLRLPLQIMKIEIMITRANSAIETLEFDLASQHRANEAAIKSCVVRLEQTAQRAKIEPPRQIEVLAPVAGRIKHASALSPGSRIRSKQPLIIIQPTSKPSR